MCLFHQASENLSGGVAKIVGSKKYVGKTCPGWRLIFLFLSSSSFFLSFKTLLHWILNTTVKDEHISSSTFCIDVSRISIFSLCYLVYFLHLKQMFLEFRFVGGVVRSQCQIIGFVRTGFVSGRDGHRRLPEVMAARVVGLGQGLALIP